MSDWQAQKQAGKEERLDRHSASGRSGAPSKSGHGKGGWGVAGTEVDPQEVLADIAAENDAYDQNEEVTED